MKSKFGRTLSPMSSQQLQSNWMSQGKQSQKPAYCTPLLPKMITHHELTIILYSQ